MDKQDVIELLIEGWSSPAICMYSQHTSCVWSITAINALRKECKLVVDLPH